MKLRQIENSILEQIDIMSEMNVIDGISLLPEMSDIFEELINAENYKAKKKAKTKLQYRQNRIKLVFNQLYLKGLVRSKSNGEWLTLAQYKNRYPKMDSNLFSGKKDSGEMVKSKDWNKLVGLNVANGELVYVGSELCQCVWPDSIKKLS